MKTIMNLFNHKDWADGRILETLEKTPSGHPQAVKLFAHILHAERVWLTRLQGESSGSLPLQSDASLAECARLVDRNRESYAAYLAKLTEADLDASIHYSNQSGRKYDNSVRDILTHVALHGHYHRGQINALLRKDGLEPVDVDFITFVR